MTAARTGANILTMKTLDIFLIGFASMTIGFGVVVWAKAVAFNDHHTIKIMGCVNATPFSVSREEAFLRCEQELKH